MCVVHVSRGCARGSAATIRNDPESTLRRTNENARVGWGQGGRRASSGSRRSTRAECRGLVATIMRGACRAQRAARRGVCSPAQRGSCSASWSRSAWSVRRCAASSGARNSFSTLLPIARSSPSASLPAGVRLTRWRRRSSGSRLRSTRPLLLELVEEADEVAAVVAERVGDLALRLARALVEQREHRVVLRRRARSARTRHRRVLDHEAEPLEQERVLRSTPGAVPDGGCGGHGSVRWSCSLSSVAQPSMVACYRCLLPRLKGTIDHVIHIADTSTTGAALERARADRHRAVHGHPRRRDRERRAAVDQDRPRLLAGEPAVGRSRPTRSSSAARCCSAAGSATCSAAGASSSPGSAVFSASSLLCGLAWSEASLIAFRALQGLGGALLAPAALALLMTTFAEGRERNRRARHLRRGLRQRRRRRRPARRRC